MYRVSDDLDLREIIGSEIQQICCGKYDVQFHFSSGTKIAVQGDVTMLDGDRIIGNWTESRNWTNVFFQQLLNLAVIGYSIPNDRLLQINFDRELALQLHDSSDQYESFQIYRTANDEIVVI